MRFVKAALIALVAWCGLNSPTTAAESCSKLPPQIRQTYKTEHIYWRTVDDKCVYYVDLHGHRALVAEAKPQEKEKPKATKPQKTQYAWPKYWPKDWSTVEEVPFWAANAVPLEGSHSVDDMTVKWSPDIWRNRTVAYLTE